MALVVSGGPMSGFTDFSSRTSDIALGHISIGDEMLPLDRSGGKAKSLTELSSLNVRDD